MIGFAVGVAVGAILGVPAFVVITNWLDLRYLRQLSAATRAEQEKEMRREKP